MIDFVKLRIRDTNLIQYVRNKDILKMDKRIEHNGYWNDIKTNEVMSYKGIVFCFYADRMEIMFKPHYYFNNNDHNGNDFHAGDCMTVITQFIQEFDLSDRKAEIMQLEFGVNFISGSYRPDKVISFAQYHFKNRYETGDLAYFKKFYSINSKNGQRQVNDFKIIKFYWKGNQFSGVAAVDPDTLRFEVKSKKRTYINGLGITHIEDLVNEPVFRRFKTEIEKEFTNILFIDYEANRTSLKQKESDKLQMYLSDYFWYSTIQKDRDRNAFSRHKKNYNSLLDKTGNNIHTELLKVIVRKTDQLLKIGADFSRKQTRETKIIALEPSADFSHNTNSGQSNGKPNIGADLTIYKDEICTTLCSVTGVDISMQKPDSILLSHTGLLYYYKNDRSLFDSIALKYLSSKWFESPVEVQIKEIAHNIRNSRSNRKIKETKIYPIGQINFLSKII